MKLFLFFFLILASIFFTSPNLLHLIYEFRSCLSHRCYIEIECIQISNDFDSSKISVIHQNKMQLYFNNFTEQMNFKYGAKSKITTKKTNADQKIQHHPFPFNLSISYATRTINYFRSIHLAFSLRFSTSWLRFHNLTKKI